MTHSYKISNVTCGSCVARITNNLLLNPDILEAKVQIEEPQATISMQHHLSIDELQSIIGVDSKYRISEVKTGHEPGASVSWLRTYKPLLLIFGYIFTISVITSDGSLVNGMNTFMAAFFLTFSFFKLLDLKGFASSYSMYDLLAAKFPGYGFIYPFIELSLGLAYLTGFYPDFTNTITVFVMGFSSIGVIKSVLNRQKIRCACLGAVFNLPMSTVTIIEDVLMVVMAAAMLLH